MVSDPVAVPQMLAAGEVQEASALARARKGMESHGKLSKESSLRDLRPLPETSCPSRSTWQRRR